MNLMLYYDLCFLTSVIMALIYIAKWHKHVNVHMTLIFTLVPIANMGYILLYSGKNLEAAVLGNKIVYIGGCFLLLVILLAILSLCDIHVTRWVKMAVFCFTAFVYITILSIGGDNFLSNTFYTNVTYEQRDGIAILTKEYGFMHTVFYVMVISYLVLCLAAIIYSYFWQKSVSNKLVTLLFAPGLISTLAFFGGKLMNRPGVELVPAAFAAAEVFYLVIVHQISLYDVTDTGIDSMVQRGDTGFISFDYKYRYLGSNEPAQAIFPDLLTLRIDQPIRDLQTFRETFVAWMDDYVEDPAKNKVIFPIGDKIYLLAINVLYNGNKARGYQFLVTDDTNNQKYITLLKKFQETLQSRVKEKTHRIEMMNDRFIMGMATMVESRDNSTGGHIRRTRDTVRILVEEIQKDDPFKKDPGFYEALIKAAPMHDLGKIAVDDAVLRKPGRFTDEEFEKMKKHAAEGARIVSEILRDAGDEYFRHLATNVAHYHHERWDGSGYPEGLRGEDIPLEARIMAIADVYDALVSKRVYKERMDFDEADRIITDGMGKHFDPKLLKYYEAARPKLEDYYYEDD